MLLRQRPSSKEMEHFRLINQLRANGFRCPDGSYFSPNHAPLKFDCRLWRAARGWSNRMATERFEGHRHKGSTACQRTADAGYPRNKGCGENLALGDGNPATAIRQLQESNEHCKNMGDPAYNMVGVGLIHNSGSKFRYYWTDSFGAYHRSPDQSCIGGSAAPRVPATCYDKDRHNCGLYKKQGQCASNPNVKSHCRDTCCIGECACGGGGHHPAPAPHAGGGCKDTPGVQCSGYRSDPHYCRHDASVRHHCKKTCGLCR